MEDTLPLNIKGHICIRDKLTGEVLVDKDNAIHFGNISTKLAEALAGKHSSFLTYMAFGNGGVTVDNSGLITYRPPNVSSNKVPTAQLYNTTMLYEMENYNSDVQNNLEVVVGGGVANFEDITCTVTLDETIPTEQQVIDLADGVNNETGTLISNNYVFNEIALYTGLKNFDSKYVTSSQKIQEFLNTPGIDSPRLITHVIFHPVQKAANRELEITYTLRIRMG